MEEFNQKPICWCRPDVWAVILIVLNKKHFRSHSYTWPVPLLNGILSLVLFVSGILGASHGKLSNLYTNQYEFNNATEKFGLATSLRLDMIRQNTVRTLEVEEGKKNFF